MAKSTSHYTRLVHVFASVYFFRFFFFQFCLSHIGISAAIIKFRMDSHIRPKIKLFDLLKWNRLDFLSTLGPKFEIFHRLANSLLASNFCFNFIFSIGRRKTWNDFFSHSFICSAIFGVACTFPPSWSIVDGFVVFFAIIVIITMNGMREIYVLFSYPFSALNLALWTPFIHCLSRSICSVCL